MPTNDGGALPGENDGGAPQQIQFAGGGVLFPDGFQLVGMQAAGQMFAQQVRNIYDYWGPGYTAEAEQAAEDALRRALTLQQASTWSRCGWLALRSDRGHWWRIRGSSVSGNVDLLSSEHGPPLAAFCAHPNEVMPYAAHHLSQLLTLTHDEARFTRVAICHYGYPLADGLQVAPDVQALLPGIVPWVNMDMTWAAR